MGKSTKTKVYNKRHLTAFILTLAGFGLAGQPIDALANPQGGQVIAGSAIIQQETPSKVGITQATTKAIIDWRIFSIGANEQTQFYQPSASSVALNRVVGEDPSKILGRLTANGQVFLVNPNGIFFGKNAQIDVAGLVASTHNIRNEDFLAGNYNFNIPGKTGTAVINEGTVRIADTGIAAFVAPSVANRGIVVAKLGKIALAAANGFTLDFSGDELLTFLVSDNVAQTAFDTEGRQLTSFVENAGRIEAQGGYVLLSAKAAENAIHSVINQSGVIEATSAGQQNGEIVLAGGLHGVASNTGTLDASGKGQNETGGTVQITGEKITLLAGSRIDVSGDQGGGKAIIGGDYLGGKASDATMAKFGIKRESREIQTAVNTTMAYETTITADAISNGKGGKVVLWSDELTQVHGQISSKGGQQAGDGGFIETSSAKTLDISGAKISTNAVTGKSGEWLLDPEIFIVDAAAASSIEDALNANTNITVSATSTVEILEDITKSSGTDKTFSVFANFIYQHEGADVTSGAGKLNVLYEATDRIWIGRGWEGGESNFATNGGDITFHGPNFVGVNGVIDAGAGKILIKAENKDSEGIDKGIWIFGATILRGGTVSLVTSDTLRQDSAAKIIRNVVEANTLGQIAALTNTMAILDQIAEKAEALTGVPGIDMRTMPNQELEKSLVKLSRNLTGLSKLQAASINKIASNAGLVLNIAELIMNTVDLSQANNIGAIAGATNVLFNNLAKLAGATGGGSIGSAAGTLTGGPLGSVLGGIIGALGGSLLADMTYDEFIAKYVVEITADLARNDLRKSTGNVLGI